MVLGMIKIEKTNIRGDWNFKYLLPGNEEAKMLVNVDTMENIQFLLLTHYMVRKASIMYDVLNKKH